MLLLCTVQSSLVETLTLVVGIKIAPGYVCVRQLTIQHPAPPQLSLPRAKLSLMIWILLWSYKAYFGLTASGVRRSADKAWYYWRNIAEDFSSRDSTFSSDKVIAVAGIVSVLAPKLGSLVRYLAGL